MKKFSLQILIIVGLALILDSFIFLCVREKLPMLYYPEPHRFGQLLGALERNSADIVFLGDSVLTTSADNEDPAGIQDYLQKDFPELKVYTLNHSGFRPPEYLELCRFMASYKHKPKIVIIPINLCTFSYSLLGDQPEMQELRAYLRNDYTYFVFYRPLLLFKSDIFSRIQEQDMNNAAFYFYNTKLGTYKDYLDIVKMTDKKERIIKGLSFQFHYQLDNQYPFVKDLMECAKVLKAHDIKPVFLILPSPYGYVQEYLSQDYMQLVDRNISFLDSLFQNQGDPFLDLSHSLPKESFLWEYYPNAHLKHEGRAMVALKLGQYIKNLNVK